MFLMRKSITLKLLYQIRRDKYKDLSEEQIDWLTEFMDRSDMTYINPGKRDHVYIGKFDEKSLYV